MHINVSRMYVVPAALRVWPAPVCCLATLLTRPPSRSPSVRQCSAECGGSDSSPAPVQGDVQPQHNIRNIGIMAHIDAGKTTTTERMLYYSGLTRTMGEVHDGDTVMDFMEQERERGITIGSATITLPWQDHRINLVDTPGHVDFTMEVERTLRVLDGAVAILDASAGVEAQTVTVWGQADRYQVPRICYLNKMDKPTASLHLCLTSIKKKLRVSPLITQLPIGQGRQFRGLVDLVSMCKLLWDPSTRDHGSTYHSQPLSPEDGELWGQAREARLELTDRLADLHNPLAEHVLEQESLEDAPPPLLHAALRSATLHQRGVPLLVGSSYRNIGVQPVLDAVVRYLPSPCQRPPHPAARLSAPRLCALVFKIVHDRRRGGALSFLRIYSGTLEKGQRVYNVGEQQAERVGRLMIAYADEYKEVSSVGPGNIVVVTGLKTASTGDTLMESASQVTSVQKKLAREGADDQAAMLLGVQIPEPVFFCSVEAPSASQQKALEDALAQLQREDPSLRVSLDQDTGQTVLSGMGELHLEVIRDRIQQEHKVEAELGPLQVAYRESATVPATHTHQVNKLIGERRQEVTVSLIVEPEPSHKFSSVQLAFNKDNIENLHSIRRQHLVAVNRGVGAGLRSGPVLGLGVEGVRVQLAWLQVGRHTSETMVAAAATMCVHQALSKAGCHLLEPYMLLELVVEEGLCAAVLGDLSRRRATVLTVDQRQEARVLRVECPLAELLGYSTALRVLTSGTATFSMELADYRPMNPTDQATAIQRITGFAPL